VEKSSAATQAFRSRGGVRTRHYYDFIPSEIARSRPREMDCIETAPAVEEKYRKILQVGLTL
jgi:hypothetical protein